MKELQNLQKQNYDLAEPGSIIELAGVLGKFITERKLSTNIQGKQYVNVEGWQFAGLQLGMVPIVKELLCLASDNLEIKYRCTVELKRLSNNEVIGTGIAICSNKEYSKKKFDEYAILSMAQTRAIGKAYRNLLAWLMKAAGFEATPAEEMDFKNGGFDDVPSKEDLQYLRELVYNSTLDEDGKYKAFESIDKCIDYKMYDKIKYRLEDLQQNIDTQINPSQKTITSHLKKLA